MIKNNYTFICFIALILFGSVIHANPEQFFGTNLKQKLTDTRSDEYIRINIFLEEQFHDSFQSEKIGSFRTPSERRSYVVSELRSLSQKSQESLITFLTGEEKSESVKDIRPLWIVNVVNCYAKPEVIYQLAGMKGIAEIDYDKEQQVIDPDFYKELTVIEADKLDDRSSIAWHVNHINAPQVWELGYDGEDVVVAVLDSGVNFHHQDLAGRMWTHPDYPNHGFNFIDSNTNTMDYFFHGTHVAGIVAGNGTAGNITGVAPGATIMAIKVLSNSGGGTQWGVWAGMQFSVENGAHILNMSLGWSYSWSPNRSGWRTAMVNSLNAGVIAAVAAGNEGSMFNQPNNVRTPGDCPAPWTHPHQTAPGGNSAAVTVGSTMISDIISGFSSRGPVTWSNIAPFNDYPLHPQTGLIVPDIVAPGSEILSISNQNNAGYFLQSGTSMATPAVAGVMAMMLQKNPGLSPVQISKILEETALKLSTTKSNVYGSGRVDALAAITATPFLGVHYHTHNISDSLGNNDGNVNPGEIIHVSLELENLAAIAYEDVFLRISSNSQHVMILDTLVSIGDFQPNEIKTLDDVFSFQALESLPGHYRIGFVLQAASQQNEDHVWLSDFFESSAAPFLEVLDVQVNDSLFGNNNGSADPGELVTLFIPVKNTGHILSNPVELTVDIEGSQVVVLSETSFTSDPIEAGAQYGFYLDLGILADSELGSSFDMFFSIESGAHSFSWVQTMVIGKYVAWMQGPIPTTQHANPNTNALALEPGFLRVVIPEGATITGVDVSYDMVSRNGSWISDQRSYLKCVSEGGTKETHITPGSATSDQGRESYHRTGLTIANGVIGNEIDFELHAFRVWGGTGSNTDFSFVADSTWRVIVHYQLPPSEHVFRIVNDRGETVADAAIEIDGNLFQTNESGEATVSAVRGCHLVQVDHYKHRTVEAYFVHLQDDVITEIVMERMNGVVFDLSDPSGNPIAQATVTLNDAVFDALEIFGLEDGSYSYSISSEGFARVDGEFVMDGQDVHIALVLDPVFSVSFNVVNEFGQTLDQAVITLEGETFSPGFHSFTDLMNGHYAYLVENDFHLPYTGIFELLNSDLTVDVTLMADGTGVTETGISGFAVFPNPASGYVIAEFDAINDVFAVRIIDNMGRVVREIIPDDDCTGKCSFIINLSGLQTGVYLLRFDGRSGSHFSKLFVK